MHSSVATSLVYNYLTDICLMLFSDTNKDVYTVLYRLVFVTHSCFRTESDNLLKNFMLEQFYAGTLCSFLHSVLCW